MSARTAAVVRLVAPVLAVALALSACTSASEPAPDPSTSSTETLIPPSDLGDVVVEGAVRVDGDTGRLSGTLVNNSPDEITVIGVSCACATGIRLGTIGDDGTLVPLSGGMPVAPGGTLSFGGEGELQVELSGLFPTTVPDAVVPVMAFVADRDPVQGVATVSAG